MDWKVARCSENAPHVLLGRWGGAPHSRGSLGCRAGLCGVASFPLEYSPTFQQDNHPPRSQPLPSRAPAEQTRGVHTVPTPDRNTQRWVSVRAWVPFLQGTRGGFWLPSLRPLLSNSTQLFWGRRSSPPSDHELLGHWEAWSVSSVNPGLAGSRPRVCPTSPDGLCRPGTAA